MYLICPDRCAIIRTKIRGGGRKRKEKRNEQIQMRDHGERHKDFGDGDGEDADGSEKARPDAVLRRADHLVERRQSGIK